MSPPAGISSGSAATASARRKTAERTPNLKLPRRFTDLDRDTFVDEAFESIALTFKERLAELEASNEHIKTRFQRVDAHCFTASVYTHGDMAGGAKVFRGGWAHRDAVIHLGYDLSLDRTSYNEWLAVEHDDVRLYLKAGGIAHQLGSSAQKQKLDPEEAADYLWSLMMAQVQARLR